MSDYSAFLKRRLGLVETHGFKPAFMPDYLFDFQKLLVEWAIVQGRAALFADCGLGKTPMQLVWAENIVRHTNKRVLILTPLAVSRQTIEEGEKFHIDCYRSLDGCHGTGKIVVTNYERLHYFDPSDFVGVVCDESSILKSFDGARRQAITEFMRHVSYRLLCTATAAPNDFTEMGTSSEALGYLGHIDMLNRFFKNEMGNSAMRRRYGKVVKWRFKGHARTPFWRWVASWARALRRPSDLGCNDKGFELPPLTERQHMVIARRLAEGMLFSLPAVGLREQREERRRTITERCEKVAGLVNGGKDPALVWCHLNAEGDLLESLIPDAVQVSGRDSDEAKEEKLGDFAHGRLRVLVTKPKIGAWGLNFQHCAHVTMFPSHSFEQYYQAVRRCWRFGQKRPVVVDMVTTEGERDVLVNLQRKAGQADQMFTDLVTEMGHSQSVRVDREATTKEEVPAWLS